MAGAAAAVVLLLVLGLLEGAHTTIAAGHEEAEATNGESDKKLKNTEESFDFEGVLSDYDFYDKVDPKILHFPDADRNPNFEYATSDPTSRQQLDDVLEREDGGANECKWGSPDSCRGLEAPEGDAAGRKLEPCSWACLGAVAAAGGSAGRGERARGRADAGPPADDRNKERGGRAQGQEAPRVPPCQRKREWPRPDGVSAAAAAQPQPVSASSRDAPVECAACVEPRRPEDAGDKCSAQCREECSQQGGASGDAPVECAACVEQTGRRREDADKCSPQCREECSQQGGTSGPATVPIAVSISGTASVPAPSALHAKRPEKRRVIGAAKKLQRPADAVAKDAGSANVERPSGARQRSPAGARHAPGKAAQGRGTGAASGGRAAPPSIPASARRLLPGYVAAPRRRSPRPPRRHPPRNSAPTQRPGAELPAVRKRRVVP